MFILAAQTGMCLFSLWVSLMDDCDDALAAAHLYNQFKQLNLNNPHAPIGDYKYYSSKNLKMCVHVMFIFFTICNRDCFYR